MHRNPGAAEIEGNEWDLNAFKKGAVWVCTQEEQTPWAGQPASWYSLRPISVASKGSSSDHDATKS